MLQVVDVIDITATGTEAETAATDRAARATAPSWPAGELSHDRDGRQVSYSE